LSTPDFKRMLMKFEKRFEVGGEERGLIQDAFLLKRIQREHFDVGPKFNNDRLVTLYQHYKFLVWISKKRLNRKYYEAKVHNDGTFRSVLEDLWSRNSGKNYSRRKTTAFAHPLRKYIEIVGNRYIYSADMVALDFNDF